MPPEELRNQCLALAAAEESERVRKGRVPAICRFQGVVEVPMATAPVKVEVAVVVAKILPTVS